MTRMTSYFFSEFPIAPGRPTLDFRFFFKFAIAMTMIISTLPDSPYRGNGGRGADPVTGGAVTWMPTSRDQVILAWGHGDSWKDSLRTEIGVNTLSGKVIWITGASSGIGEHIAYQLSAAGCKMVLSARRKEELERVKQGCLQYGRNKLFDDDVLVLPLDVVQFETHNAAVQQVLEHFKKIDILVNNAGKFQRAHWTNVELNVDREIFEIDVLGPVSLTQAVLPHMIERKEGQIAVMSSIAGRAGLQEIVLTLYCIIKPTIKILLWQ